MARITPVKTYIVTRNGVACTMRIYKEGCTAESEIAKWHPDLQAEVSSVREISEADIPVATVDFKRAWRDDGKAIVVDMDAAKEVTRERLRAERAPKLAELDVEYQRADEVGDLAKKQEIAARKQTLRDVTKRCDACRTLDDLREIKP